MDELNNETVQTEQTVFSGKYSLLGRLILSLIFPPLAVFDKGIWTVVLIYILTVLGFIMGAALSVTTCGLAFFTGWIPAVLLAMLICCKKESVATEEKTETDTAVKVTPRDIFILLIRYLLCLIFPPLGVIDQGCGSVIAVFFFTLCGWIPGVILAFLITLKRQNYYRIKK